MALRSGFWEHRDPMRMRKDTGREGKPTGRTVVPCCDFWALTRAGRVDRRKQINEAKDTELIGREEWP